MKFECPHCTQRIELYVKDTTAMEGVKVTCPTCSQTFDLPELDKSQDWLEHITIIERKYWESKPQSEKDHWYANTEPGERGEMLRGEISTMAKVNELHHLPAARRDAILKGLDEKATASDIEIRKLLAKEPDSI
jgi:predicted Zn finger-like uncharacterized protein